MLRPPKPCGKCGQKAIKGGLCTRHYKQADVRRGNSSERGYDQRHRDRFRDPVLAKYPYCPCGEPATVADHYPIDRRDLMKMRLDPNDPQYGRGLCKRCHDKYTASKSFRR
jgi:5-methylcytosine-specific restriction enzyme A